jgi:hypothetical protein
MTEIVITDEAVAAAEKAYVARWRERVDSPGAGMRAALEAARPHLQVQQADDEQFCPKCFAGMDAANHEECIDVRAPRVQVDREAIQNALRVKLVSLGVDDFFEPEKLAADLAKVVVDLSAVLALLSSSGEGGK